MAFHIHIKTPHRKCFFADKGRSARDLNGIYITKEEQNSKYFQHDTGEFHGNGMFEEGTKNQEYIQLIAEKVWKKGINVVPTSHSYKDTSLNKRIEFANWYHKNIQQGIFFSEHSDAFNSLAEGFSIFTSPGYTYSDVIAEKLMTRYRDKFQDEISTNHIKLRPDYSDGDADREARYSVLVYTNMNSLLIENLFFDNKKDALRLESDEYREEYTDLIAEWADEICM